MKPRKSIGGAAHLSYTWASVLVVHYELLPPYPGANVLAPVRAPAPPLLDHRLSMHKQAVELAGAYTNTLRHFVRKPYAFASPLKVDPNYELLCRVTSTMVAQRIPPQAWVKFSLDCFMRYVHRDRPPPAWVFSEKRLTNRLDWFGWEESFNQTQSVVWVAPEHHKLLALYEKLRLALLGRATLTPRIVEEVVDRILPARVYKELAHKSKKQYDARRKAFEIALQKGEFIW